MMMLNTNLQKYAIALLLGFAVAGMAYATISFDGVTGMGFVGKGDVQYTIGWNNPQLQANADNVQFQAVSEVVTEVSWVCTNTNNENLQQRERTTTTTVAGLVESIGRLKNQITGFNLLGYEGDPTKTSETDGPPLNSCPSGPWSLTAPAGDPVVVSTDSSLEVSPDNGANWTELLEKPTL
jgi:hypothetical protein